MLSEFSLPKKSSGTHPDSGRGTSKSKTSEVCTNIFDNKYTDHIRIGN